MLIKFDVPSPVRFNPLKHHRDTIAKFLSESTEEEMQRLYDTTQHNYIDIYTGKMAPAEIASLILKTLNYDNLIRKNSFLTWIAGGKGYRKIMLTDGSEWIIRAGNDDTLYIHIHPAKTGTHTIRFKGSTLKTFYCLQHNPEIHDSELNLNTVNKARAKINLSPVKKLEYGKGIHKCWITFGKKNKSF